MGFTGLIWVGFVLAHMAGNLLILVSADAYNKYGHAIVTNPLLPAAEAVLVLCLLIHVYTAISLTIENRKAHGGSRYAMQASGEKRSTLASRTMAVQGSLILVFVILHLITFKYGQHYETTVDGVVMRDLHRLIVEVFQQPGYIAWYLLCLILLGFHLSHGFGSVFQSFGIKNDHTAPAIRKLSIGYAVIVTLGFIVQPLYVYFLAG